MPSPCQPQRENRKKLIKIFTYIFIHLFLLIINIYFYCTLDLKKYICIYIRIYEDKLIKI